MTDVQETVRSGKDDRRASILAIAREMFLLEGYAATSMSRIAAKVGGSKATLYSYFPSKKDLFMAVADAEAAELFGHIYDFVDCHTDTRATIVAFCKRFSSMVLSDEMVAFYRMVVAESVRFPEVGLAIYEFGMKRGVERMAELIAAGMQQGMLREDDPWRAAEFLLDSTAGYLHKLRLWNVLGTVSDEQIAAQAECATRAFLAFYGNETLAKEARLRSV